MSIHPQFLVCSVLHRWRPICMSIFCYSRAIMVLLLFLLTSVLLVRLGVREREEINWLLNTCHWVFVKHLPYIHIQFYSSSSAFHSIDCITPYRKYAFILYVSRQSLMKITITTMSQSSYLKMSHILTAPSLLLKRFISL